METKELVKLRTRQIKLGELIRIIKTRTYHKLLEDKNKLFLKVIKDTKLQSKIFIKNPKIMVLCSSD